MTVPQAPRDRPAAIAIVGGGTAGCAAAALLADQGHAVTLFEAVPEPAPVGAGLLLQPTGQRVLAHLGVLDDVLAHGARVDGLFGDTPSGRTVLDMRYSRAVPGSFGLGIQRGTLFGLLWRRMARSGASVRTGVAVDGFTQDDDGVTLRAAGAEVGRFDALVLANGSFSTLRESMRVRQTHAPFPWGALWAVLPRPEGFAPVELRQRFRGARQMLGLMPVGRALDAPPGTPDGVNLFWSLPVDTFDAWRSGDLAAWRREVTTLLPMAAPLVDQVVTHATMRTARYADVWMSQWHDGRVLAIGDCAHGMSPQLGQGANMALVDALVLAHVARAARGRPEAWPDVFAHWSRERAPHLRWYQRASVALTPLFQSHARLGPALRDVFFGLGGRLPFVHDQSVAALSGRKTGWLFGRLDLERYIPAGGGAGPAEASSGPPTATPASTSTQASTSSHSPSSASTSLVTEASPR